MTQVAQQIKSLRTVKNMSQDDLAEKLYISRQAISKWETGESTPDLDKLVQLAEIFEVSLDFLFSIIFRTSLSIGKLFLRLSAIIVMIEFLYGELRIWL